MSVVNDRSTDGKFLQISRKRADKLWANEYKNEWVLVGRMLSEWMVIQKTGDWVGKLSVCVWLSKYGIIIILIGHWVSGKLSEWEVEWSDDLMSEVWCEWVGYWVNLKLWLQNWTGIEFNRNFGHGVFVQNFRSFQFRSVKVTPNRNNKIKSIYNVFQIKTNH